MMPERKEVVSLECRRTSVRQNLHTEEEKKLEPNTYHRKRRNVMYTRLWPFRVTFFVTVLEYMDGLAIARTLIMEQTSRNSLTT